MKLSQRAQKVKPSPTLAITAKAKAMRAQGIDVISFGAGEPDFDTPQHIKDAAIKALQEGFTKYTPVGGIDELKEAIVEKLLRENKVTYQKEQILVSCGGKHSLYNLAQAILDKGDEVIIPAPYWVSYPPIVMLAGGRPVIISTSEEEGFKLAPEALEEATTPKTRAVIINSPSNPTGSAYTRRELEGLAEVALRHNICIISDEIYEKIVYDGFEHVSIASISEEVKEITILVNGASKTYSMTGWRIGYAAGPPKVIGAMTRIQSQSTSNPTSFAQKGALASLLGNQEEIQVMAQEYQRRRDLIWKAITSIEGISCYKPLGAFYVFPNIGAYLGRSFKGKRIEDSSQLTGYLLDEALVAVVPGVDFGAEGYLRLSYPISLEVIQEGVKRIREVLARLD
ncbi:MAG: pyridoxal phosphate-dependent aminotransferase [Deltaproteobacteria bacterium]|nr:pyridoxal phosphate-dependent aminotransferase [Deltaproteobacteria bacterium]